MHIYVCLYVCAHEVQLTRHAMHIFFINDSWTFPTTGRKSIHWFVFIKINYIFIYTFY